MPEAEEKKKYLSAEDDEETWSNVLDDATRMLDDEGISYLAIGTIATVAMGYDEDCSDIDLLVSRSDAERALKALESRGYDTEKSKPEWLYKASKDRVLVDLIFRVGDRNEIEPDEEMFRRGVRKEIAGRTVRVVSPEDFLVMQAISNKFEAPDYWYKGLKAASCEGLDWSYIAERARVSPPRVLSLLIYALSEGLDVPRAILDELYRLLET